MTVHGNEFAVVNPRKRPFIVIAGHLSCLAMTDLYRYLSQEHELTLIGLLMGISAAKRYEGWLVTNI
jgi:hypothetical protein